MTRLIRMATVAVLAAPQLIAQGAIGGAYPVGTMRTVLVDSTRAERSRPGRDDPRRLVVQFWYPAAQPGTTAAPYLLDSEFVRGQLDEAYPDLGLLERTVAATENAAPASGRFPLVVFSHGMNTSRFLYTGLLRELASRGMVVAAIDHPFWALAMSFPDGDSLPLAEGMAAREELAWQEIDAMMQGGITAMAIDQGFIAQSVRRFPVPMQQAIDEDRIAVVGHSMGGMAATVACATYRVFRACASLDGFVWTTRGLSQLGAPPHPIDTPFLLLVAPQYLPDPHEIMVERYTTAFREPQLCLVPGTQHNSVSDLPLLRGTPTEAGGLPPATANARWRAAVGSFLAHVLRSDAGPTPTAAGLEPLGPGTRCAP